MIVFEEVSFTVLVTRRTNDVYFPLSSKLIFHEMYRIWTIGVGCHKRLKFS